MSPVTNVSDIPHAYVPHRIWGWVHEAATPRYLTPHPPAPPLEDLPLAGS